MVGSQRAVQVPPPDVDDLLVGEAEVGEQHDVGRHEVIVGERGQLDLRQQGLRPTLGHQVGTPLGRVLQRELLGVHQPHARPQRVEAEPLPGEVKERERRNDGQVHPGVAAQQLDRSLRHQGGTRHRIGDGLRSLRDRRLYQCLHNFS